MPSNPSVLPRNTSHYIQLTPASPQDACQPLVQSVPGVAVHHATDAVAVIRSDQDRRIFSGSAGSAVLIQRGSCPFAVKAANAENANAAAALIVNSDDGEFQLLGLW